MQFILLILLFLYWAWTKTHGFRREKRVQTPIETVRNEKALHNNSTGTPPTETMRHSSSKDQTGNPSFKNLGNKLFRKDKDTISKQRKKFVQETGFEEEDLKLDGKKENQSLEVLNIHLKPGLPGSKHSSPVIIYQISSSTGTTDDHAEESHTGAEPTQDHGESFSGQDQEEPLSGQREELIRDSNHAEESRTGAEPCQDHRESFSREDRDVPTSGADLRGAAYPRFANRRTRRNTFHSLDPSHSQRPDDLVNRDFFDAGARDDGESEGSFLGPRGAAYPCFANRRTRLDTFRTWDPSHSQRPDDLVNLGFFYAGSSDYVKCFYCGLPLKIWRPASNAAYQHARFRPQCLYNKFVKGQAFIEQVQCEMAAEGQGRDFTPRNVARAHTFEGVESNGENLFRGLPQHDLCLRNVVRWHGNQRNPPVLHQTQDVVLNGGRDFTPRNVARAHTFEGVESNGENLTRGLPQHDLGPRNVVRWHGNQRNPPVLHQTQDVVLNGGRDFTPRNVARAHTFEGVESNGENLTRGLPQHDLGPSGVKWRSNQQDLIYFDQEDVVLNEEEDDDGADDAGVAKNNLEEDVREGEHLYEDS